MYVCVLRIFLFFSECLQLSGALWFCVVMRRRNHQHRRMLLLYTPHTHTQHTHLISHTILYARRSPSHSAYGNCNCDFESYNIPHPPHSAPFRSISHAFGFLSIINFGAVALLLPPITYHFLSVRHTHTLHIRIQSS